MFLIYKTRAIDAASCYTSDFNVINSEILSLKKYFKYLTYLKVKQKNYFICFFLKIIRIFSFT